LQTIFKLLKITIMTSKTNSLFEKRVVAELSAEEMLQVDGGTTPLCVVGAVIVKGAVASSTWCAAGAIFVAGAVVGYLDN
jgi:hypothetical protein